jgi:ASPIC/UnbV protein/VCBS repeat protein
VIADFDGDGRPDLLCATAAGLFLFKGSASGRFDEPPKLVWSANPPLRYAQVLTCGDIDGDGDLDLFLAQYKIPDRDFEFPAPYYDCNDGHPSYLLLNDGQGNFTDITESSGLGPKRHRRTFSASFARIAGDQYLDLFVVSDFAGLDVYRNDGHGHFTDITAQCASDTKAFGMSHALADFNRDGRLDLLMIGMQSPTASRLDHLGLWRSDVTEDHSMRSRMTFGNRLFMGRPDGGFEQTPLNDSIAHSGWSWGCCAADFDNDGFPDVYIANGFESTKSVQDFEVEFWLHHIYLGHAYDQHVLGAYMDSETRFARGPDRSYGGYEINRLYFNQGGASFLEAGHLMGVAMQQDCRNVVSDDLDGDGRMDLLVTTYEFWPKARQVLYVYRNLLEGTGNWIGFRFREEGRGKSPVGLTVTLHYDGHTAVRELVTGDSYRSQSPNTIHFGLGKATTIDSAEILWPNGQKVLLNEPAINRYHKIAYPISRDP